jgi:hypothetical protein
MKHSWFTSFVCCSAAAKQQARLINIRMARAMVGGRAVFRLRDAASSGATNSAAIGCDSSQTVIFS